MILIYDLEIVIQLQCFFKDNVGEFFVVVVMFGEYYWCLISKVFGWEIFYSE